ncbi:MAG: DUF2330 domain-containing protein [Polyangiaceae bacterium]
MPRFTPYLFTLALAFFLLARTAGAAGAVLVPAGERVQVLDVRYAIAMSSSRTTRWISLRVDRFPSSMAWILPVRSGAAVAEVGEAWLDALDVATAPRIVAPRCSDAGTAPAEVVTESRRALAPSAPSLHRAVFDDVTALRAFAESFGFAIDAETASRMGELVERGSSLLVLVYGGPVDATTTRTVRISDDALPAVSLSLTGGGEMPISVTAYVFADTRTRLGPGSEIEIDGAQIAVTQARATNYAAALRTALLASNGERWAIETAAHELVFEGVPGPAGAAWSPGVAPTYTRWAAQADRTDASDLNDALFGLDPAKVWLTRASGIVPARAFGDDLAITRRENDFKSPFLAANAGPATCPAVDGGGARPGGRPTNPGYPPGTDPPLPPRDPDPPVPPSTPPYPVGSTNVGVSCACAPGGPATAPPPGDESCDGGDPTGPEADDCAGSPDDAYAGDDSCDGGGSSSGSSDSCDGSSSGGSDSCDGGSSSSSDECSTARGTRGRRSSGAKPRVSVVVLGLAAVALVWRRAARQRRASTGARIGFGQ